MIETYYLWGMIFLFLAICHRSQAIWNTYVRNTYINNKSVYNILIWIKMLKFETDIYNCIE